MGICQNLMVHQRTHHRLFKFDQSNQIAYIAPFVINIIREMFVSVSLPSAEICKSHSVVFQLKPIVSYLVLDHLPGTGNSHPPCCT